MSQCLEYNNVILLTLYYYFCGDSFSLHYLVTGRILAKVPIWCVGGQGVFIIEIIILLVSANYIPNFKTYSKGSLMNLLERCLQE